MSYALGIDVGSSKVAAVIVEPETGKTVDAVSVLHAADADTEPLYSEQDPQVLLRSVEVAIKGLQSELRRSVQAIGVCGQMHGVVLWKAGNRDNSQLITWQDKRTSDGAFLSLLRQTTGLEQVLPGYGVVTLAWLAEQSADWLNTFERSGTIMDFLVSRICDLDEGLIDETNASSWGFYDAEATDWCYDAVTSVNVPTDLLPTIVKTGSRAGEVSHDYATNWGVPQGTPVTVACGDNPAAVYSACAYLDSGCYLNLGTGGQLAVVADPDQTRELVDIPGFEVRPFPKGKELVVTTSMCGGQAFSWLVDSVECWLKELGCDPIARDEIFKRLNKLGQTKPTRELPNFLPYFSEERHAPGLLGSVSGLTAHNVSLASLTRSLAVGMVRPLFDRMPSHLLADKHQVIGTGNGIRRSELLKEIVEDVSGMTLIVPDVIEDAASGAAMLAAESVG